MKRQQAKQIARYIYEIAMHDAATEDVDKYAFTCGYLFQSLISAYEKATAPTIKNEIIAIQAANAVKLMGGDRIAQDTAAIYASALVDDGKTGATAVENGYRVGMGLELLA